jgi:hypothetical protein
VVAEGGISLKRGRARLRWVSQTYGAGAQGVGYSSGEAGVVPA